MLDWFSSCHLDHKILTVLKTEYSCTLTLKCNKENKLNFKYTRSLCFFSNSTATVGLTLGAAEFPQLQKGRNLKSFLLS